MRHSIAFILNDKYVETRAPQGLLVLDYLRQHAHLVGTKEGCKEGDCGACTILVGSLRNGVVDYQPITSCLMPLGEAHGKQLVTIEGLNRTTLTPVQQAIVDEGASQCGFCTPGFVVSLTGMLLQGGEPDIDLGLSGNLCRCTGYRSLKDSAAALSPADGLQAAIAEGHVPEYFSAMAQRLADIPEPVNNADDPESATIIAGGTDIYVQQGATLPDGRVNLLGMSPTNDSIETDSEHISIGAGVTFGQFGESDVIREIVPAIKDYLSLVASWQIRNRATIGGNIVNASPIADMTILLLALQAELGLTNGKSSRTVPLAEFYLGYKQLDLASGELLSQIVVPRPTATTRIHFEKGSKRRRLDIATVNSAVNFDVGGDGTIRSAQIAVGGVAPIPLLLIRSGARLIGRHPDRETVGELLQIAQDEIAPISDVRGSADYKRLLLRQQLMIHFTTLFPQSITPRELYATH